jgi:hypothetical protein
MKNAVFWDASPCGSSKNGRFEGVTPLRLRDGNNQLIRKTLAVGSNCSTLGRINRYMRKDAMKCLSFDGFLSYSY